MKTFSKLAIATLAAVSLNVHAEKLSDIQEGALYGVGGTLLLQHIFKRDTYTSSRQPVYQSTYPASSGQYPALDPVREAYEQGQRERQAAELRQQQEYAYQCGRYGNYCDKL